MARKVLCLIGSGAVENAWDPVIAALKETEDFNTVRCPETANLALAHVVYLARWFHSQDESELGPDELTQVREAREQSKNTLQTVQGVILKHLRDPRARRLRARRQLRAVIERFVADGYWEIITTNWDMTLENALKRIDSKLNCRHLHGDVSSKELYLPTEIAREPYRSKESCSNRAAHHRMLIDAVEKADRLVLYGLSLSPLDAELAALISAGTHEGPLREAVVVDRKPKPVEHRLRVLIHPSIRDRVEFSSYCPENLRMEWGKRR